MSVLEFIAALKWPVTILILAGITGLTVRRNPGTGASFARWLQNRDVRLSVAGQELAATLANAQRSMTTATGSDEELAQAAREASVGDGGDPVTTLRREAVEAVLRSAAIWGWEAAQAGGYYATPELDVHWTENGEPIIRYQPHSSASPASSYGQMHYGAEPEDDYGYPARDSYSLGGFVYPSSAARIPLSLRDVANSRTPSVREADLSRGPADPA